MMTADEERWAEALQILRWKGADAGAYVAERIAALALARGEAGVVRFNAIAARLDRLLAGTVQ